MRIRFFIILLLCWQCTCLAQQPVAYDSSGMEVRQFSKKSIDNYKSDKTFQYEKYKEPPKSLWDRFWDWFWEQVRSVLSTKEGSYTFNTILIVLAVVVLVFFIMKVTGMSKAGLFGRKSRSGIDYSVSDEDIHSIDFDEALQRAIDDRNFRLAVRLLYLQSLKYLADRNLISWQHNKTNTAYVQELEGTAYRQSFNNLTLQFENNWYGDIPIDATEFSEVREQFNHFNRQLH